MPTLDKLMTSDNAAWLWDGALGRIVWANPAGIRIFGGETLFDLIDLVFDPLSDAVMRIEELGRKLTRGKETAETFVFAAAAGLLTVDCRCMLHSLADGRDGVLVVATGQAAGTGAGLKYMGGMLAALPMAVAVVERDGGIVLSNEAMRGIAGERGVDRLGDIVGDEDLARQLLATAEAARACTLVRRLTSAHGPREFRLTLRRMDVSGDQDGPAFLMLAEDVTERRRLERRLSGLEEDAPGPGVPSAAARNAAAARRLSEEEARAFARLGDDLARDNGATVPAPPPARPRSPVPGIIQRTLDARAQATLIYRDGELLCANRALADLLGYGNCDAMHERSDIIAAVRSAHEGATLDIAAADGRRVRVMVRHQTFPWNTGPVPMVTLAPASDEVETPGAGGGAVVEVPAQEPAPAAEPPATVAMPPAVADLPPLQPDATEPALPRAQDADGFAMPADELRHILDTASDGIITLDAAGHILGFSAGAEAIFGYGEAELRGKPLVDLVTTASRRIVRDYLSAFEDGGMASVFNDGREVEAVVKQGGTAPLFVTIGQMAPPAAGAATGGQARNRPAFCVVVRDITQWKKTESELRSAKEDAERASRQKSEFLANISHELRTPLNAILGFSDVMRSERFGEMRNERYRGYANDIHTSGEHLLSLINDLLDLSKVEAGKLELNFTSVNLANLVDEVIALLQDQSTAARVVLRKSLSSGIPNVVADLRSMKQILLNLVSNAIKFTDAGGQIVISLRMHKSGELTLSVKDTGIGMSATELARALEPFQRIEPSGRQQQAGTGLGLPLTRALAEANRTRFAIQSEPKRGTLVEITFPVPRVLA